MSATYENRAEDIQLDDFYNDDQPANLVVLNLTPATRAGYRRYYGDEHDSLVHPDRNGSGTCTCKKKFIYMSLFVIVLLIVLSVLTYFLACEWVGSCSSKLRTSSFYFFYISFSRMFLEKSHTKSIINTTTTTVSSTVLSKKSTSAIATTLNISSRSSSSSTMSTSCNVFIV